MYSAVFCNGSFENFILRGVAFERVLIYLPLNILTARMKGKLTSFDDSSNHVDGSFRDARGKLIDARNSNSNSPVPGSSSLLLGEN